MLVDFEKAGFLGYHPLNAFQDWVDAFHDHREVATDKEYTMD